jgi:hypothetical protein
MKTVLLEKSDLAGIAATRVLLGIGIGLLLTEKLLPEHRRAAGMALVATGLITTVPFAIKVFSSRSRCCQPGPQ